MKKFLSFALAAMFTLVSAMPAIAVDDKATAEQVGNFNIFCDEIALEYGIDNEPGDIKLIYTDETFSDLNSDILSARKLIDDFDNGATISESTLNVEYKK